MTWVLDSSGTKTATVSGASCTFSTSVPTVTCTQTAAANDMVVFAGTTAPTGVTFGTTYYVISAGLSGSAFEFSATQGGSAIQVSSTGSGVTATFEHVLYQDSTNGTIVGEWDTSNLASGDLVELRVYTITLSGGSYVQMWKGTYQHVQVANHKSSPPIASDQATETTIKQLAGTGRAFPWKVLRI